MDDSRQITSWGYIDWIQSSLMAEDSPVSIGIVNVLPFRQQAEHTHYSETQFLYMLRGYGEHIINGKHYPFSPGKYFSLPSGAVHMTINNGPETMQELMLSIPVHLKSDHADEVMSVAEDFDPEFARKTVADGISQLVADSLDRVEMPIVLTDENQTLLYSHLLPETCKGCEEKRCPLRDSVYELHSDYGTTCSSVICPKGLTVLVQPLVLGGRVCAMVKGGLFREFRGMKTIDETLYDVPDSTVSAARLYLQDVTAYLSNYYLERKTAYRICRQSGSVDTGSINMKEIGRVFDELRSSNLNAQLRNHFLFNTLNSIAMLAVRDQSMDTYRSIIDLSELLRGLLRREGTRVPLSEEIAFLQRYLNLMLLRYEDRLQVTWRRSPAAEEAIVPHNFLQPIVENALTHGYSDSESVKELFIETAMEDGRAVVMVRDNGCGMDEEVLNAFRRDLPSDAVHGLGMVKRKLTGAFGRDFTFEIRSEKGKGTCCRFCFPV